MPFLATPTDNDSVIPTQAGSFSRPRINLRARIRKSLKAYRGFPRFGLWYPQKLLATAVGPLVYLTFTLLALVILGSRLLDSLLCPCSTYSRACVILAGIEMINLDGCSRTSRRQERKNRPLYCLKGVGNRGRFCFGAECRCLLMYAMTSCPRCVLMRGGPLYAMRLSLRLPMCGALWRSGNLRVRPTLRIASNLWMRVILRIVRYLRTRYTLRTSHKLRMRDTLLMSRNLRMRDAPLMSGKLLALGIMRPVG